MGLERQDHDFWGYPIHSQCWTLTERCLGPGVADHLKEYIDSLNGSSSSGMVDQQALFLRATKISLQEYRDTKPPDPVEIPELQKGFVLKSTNEDPVNRFQCRVDLPFDIQYMILDLVDSKDVCNLIYAFGWDIPESYWRQRLLRHRHLLFELDNLDLTSLN